MTEIQILFLSRRPAVYKPREREIKAGRGEVYEVRVGDEEWTAVQIALRRSDNQHYLMSSVQETSGDLGGLMQLDITEEEMPSTQVKKFSKEPEYQKNRPPSSEHTSRRRGVYELGLGPPLRMDLKFLSQLLLCYLYRLT